MNFLSASTIRNLVYSTGITSITKNSILTLNNIYKEIVLNITVLSQHENYINSNNVFDTLKKIKETMLQSRKQLKSPSKACKKFTQKSSQYSTSNRFKMAKMNYYKKIKQCTLVSSKQFEKVFKKVTGIKYEPQAINIIHKASDQIFQKYITLLVYKLFKQDIKTITSLHIDSSWEQFVDKYPKSSQEYNWIDFRKKELNNQFNELFNIKKNETDTDDKDDIYYFFSKKAII
uniref:Uncharacterized protein n=1 Tax=viral metagenome TaxID=1070528 RepID=A0A6C0DUV8_9ZZZZ